MSRRSDPREPRVVGFFNTSLKRGWARKTWKGLRTRAQEAGVRLVFFGGENLSLPQGIHTPKNRVYRLAEGTVDALILWQASLAIHTTPRQFEEFADGFPVPKVVLEGQLPGCPSLGCQDRVGMRDLTLHLIDDHGMRRLAYLSYLDHHPGFVERYHGFEEALVSRGLFLDPRLVRTSLLPGLERDESLVRPEFLRRWLGEIREAGAEALVCVTDEVSTLCLQVLAELGIRVPQDLALVAFDTWETSDKTSPTQTYAIPDWETLGLRALDASLSLLEGQRADPVAVAVVHHRGRSCGCSPTLSIDPTTPLTDMLIQLGCPMPEEEASTLERLWSRSESSPAPFLDLWDRLLARAEQRSPRLLGWNDVLTRLVASVGPSSALDAARLRVASYASHAPVFHQFQRGRKIAQQDRLDDDLRFFFDFPRLGEILSQHLPHLGIRSWYVFSHGSHGSSLTASVPRDQLRLVLACVEGSPRPLSSEGVPVPEGDLLPPGFWPEEPGSWVAQPLHFEEYLIGYALFEAPVDFDPAYEVIADQIGKALHGHDLMQQSLHRARQLQESLDYLHGTQKKLIVSEKMAAVGSLVRGVSHEMNTPIGTIVTASSFLLERLSMGTFEAPSLQESASLILVSARKAAGLMDRIRAVTGGDLFESQQRFSLRQVLDEVVSGFLKEPRPVHLTVIWEGLEDLEVEGVPGVYIQVMLHMLENTVDHGYPGRSEGTLRLGLGLVSPGFLEWSFEDDGRGLEPEAVDHLFEPFSSSMSNPRGAGLGTFIIWSLVTRQLGGSVTAESPPGRGLRYVVHVPRRAPQGPGSPVGGRDEVPL